ncbi:MAG TPA: PilX N-terminal domain-containing pilus assembly protein [Steroidobacteraceae bacterium]|jgi:type IV pilus assembly protein PilX
MSRTRRCTSFAVRSRQNGVALVVALILLVVATLIGLAASRGTLLQERMSSNSYDRSLAFQRSEAALRAAEAEITADGDIVDLGGVDCSVIACPAVPTNAFTGTDGNWQDVDAVYDLNAGTTPGTPQYYVQFVGTGQATSALDTAANANTGNYGSGGSPDTVAYYRVTARSSNPADLDGRSIVVLQTTVQRPL